MPSGEDYFGYRGVVAEKLRAINAKVGDIVTVKRGDLVVEGMLMPREKLYSDRQIIVLKLSNGYNIGVKVDVETSITLKSRRERVRAKPVRIQQSLNLPRATMISTGGTIVARVDYETGAVTPALTVDDLLEWIPELSNIAYVSSREVMNIFSENMTPKHWSIIAEEVYKEMTSGVDGVVVAHGTDTMSYTAAALAFAVRDKPVPIVFVGAQRSSDRPSTDSVLNLKAAFITATKAPFAESVVVMHGEISDSYALVHRGVKVRKMHSSRRDAFQTINDKPLAMVYPDKGEIKVVNEIYEPRDKDKEPVLENKFDDKVVLIKAYPGLQPEIIDFLIDKGFHGIVIEGTGLGHVNENIIPAIKRAVDEGIPVVMTTQCLFGRVDLYVYSTGRKLLEAGVIPAEDMLPETAYVKLSWIIGSKTRELREVARYMRENVAGEINRRLRIDYYPRWGK